MQLIKLSDMKIKRKRELDWSTGQYFEDNKWVDTNLQAEAERVIKLDTIDHSYWEKGWKYYLANFGNGWMLRRLPKGGEE